MQKNTKKHKMKKEKKKTSSLFVCHCGKKTKEKKEIFFCSIAAEKKMKRQMKVIFVMIPWSPSGIFPKCSLVICIYS